VRLGQGREKARAFLEENPEILSQIKQKVLDARGHGAKPSPPANGQTAE